MKNTLSDLPGVIVMYTNSTGSLLVLPIPEKHYKFFGFTKTVRFEHEKHFKTTWRKGLRVSSRTNLRWYYLRVFTLTANKPLII